MFLANILEIKRAMMNESIPLKMMKIRIAKTFDGEMTFRRVFIAAAEPVLVFPIA